jgi:hypothetical protein
VTIRDLRRFETSDLVRQPIDPLRRWKDLTDRLIDPTTETSVLLAEGRGPVPELLASFKKRSHLIARGTVLVRERVRHTAQPARPTCAKHGAAPEQVAAFVERTDVVGGSVPRFGYWVVRPLNGVVQFGDQLVQSSQQLRCLGSQGTRSRKHVFVSTTRSVTD